jgi:hypothetical protein
MKIFCNMLAWGATLSALSALSSACQMLKSSPSTATETVAAPDYCADTAVVGANQIINPNFSVYGALDSYAGISIEVRYGDEPTAAASFKPPYSTERRTAREWAAKAGMTEYTYRIQASIKDGTLPNTPLSYETPWKSSSRQTLCLSPKDWQGPRKVKLKLSPSPEAALQGMKLGVIRVEWTDCGGVRSSKTFAASNPEKLKAAVDVESCQYDSVKVKTTVDISFPDGRRLKKTIDESIVPVANEELVVPVPLEG